MSLLEKINEDLKLAMKAKDKISLEAIRSAKTAFTLAIADKGAGSILDEAEELKIIQKQVKQRKDSAAIYKQENRMDLYEKEIAEAEVLEKYLPEQLSDDELTSIIKGIIEKTGAAIHRSRRIGAFLQTAPVYSSSLTTGCFYRRYFRRN